MTPQQRRAALCIGAGLSRAATARKVGVNVRTIYGWNKSITEFSALVAAEQASNTANARMALTDLLCSDNESIRLRAASELLRLPSASAEVEDVLIFD